MTLVESIGDVGLALRRPEELVVRFRDRGAQQPAIFLVLLASAALGLAAYGLTLDLNHGAAGLLHGGLRLPLAAGAAFFIALPALTIVNSTLGSKLDWPTTALAALTTVTFGALAMLASVPINWFFSLALDYAPIRIATNAVIFAGVGTCMLDVFVRVMRALEPDRSPAYAVLWLALMGVIGVELMILLAVFGGQ